MIQLTDSGFGDIIQLAQAMLRMHRDHEHVTMEVQPAILELMQCTLGHIPNLTLVTEHPEGVPGDTVTKCWFALATEVMTRVPPGVPFIKLPRPVERVPRERPQVGIAWASHHWKRTKTWDNRSMEADELIEALIDLDVDLHSLHPDRFDEIALWPRDAIERHFFHNFTETAEFLASTIDYVVSVDTWSIHLPAAMGIPTLGLLPYASAKNANELRRWYKDHLTTFQPMREDLGLKHCANRAHDFLVDQGIAVRECEGVPDGEDRQDPERSE